MSTYHTPVLLHESVSGLDIKESGVYVDATLGGGGHTREILSHLGPKGRLIVFDQDSDALANAPQDERVIVVHNNFRYVHHFVQYYGFEGVDGILADLGVSSHQFDTSERGFSFRFDAPLDMRMNTQAKRDARSIINGYEEEEIAKLLKLYGEVDNSRKVANLICNARRNAPISTTGELAEAIKKVLPPVAEHKFLAKIYQALRIEVNGEMESLQHFLKGAGRSLKPGGRLSIITYHSLEDRMVKNFIKTGSVDGNEEKDIFGRRLSTIRGVNKKPILPSDLEIAQNTRARSAKLRIGEKTDG
ncbi:MAG: 16S rRNA (cytosine(1402)-N(4))-methyltransferase RsmH [Bacteroidales bacterium]|nr:16S rRNA (cytosine(1402)-N(4))-methyltransferase RsmH [Bacteroidales bacterium]MBO7763936.1 16S rRNA (cytosine(1402)-N(4))-methyltransferase RsmH [Bacteroidales bacterium]